MKAPEQNAKIAHAGVGSFGHLAGVLVAQEIGATVTHVPYRGAGPALNDLLGGVADLSSIAAVVAGPLVKAGKLKAYAIIGRNRFAGLPDLPTMGEVGYKKLDLDFWHMLLVPTGTPAPIVERLNAALRPALDLMQTLPTFVYLIPTLVLFGLGVVPALISTVIFALPAAIRLTQLGIASVPRALLEAGEAFGATRWQLLCKVELPSAAPLILAGITQCIMLSLSMVVIGALVGAGGLGVPVVRALNTVQIGMGVEAGFVIVLLAVILDRIMRIKRA